MAPDGTLPASCTVTDCPAGSEATLQVSVPALKVTPGGRFGLLTFVNPWTGRVSTTFRFAASDGPEFDTTIV